MPLLDYNICFRVPIYKPSYNPSNPTANIVGYTDATYLSNGIGGWVINPATGEPYVVPLGYDRNNTMSAASAAAAAGKGTDYLLDYHTGGPNDLQRSFNSTSYGGFVPAFTPIASYDVGVACSSVGYSETSCEIGGGLVNIKNGVSNKNVDTGGEWGNNPNNVQHIDAGHQWTDAKIHEFDYPQYQPHPTPAGSSIGGQISDFFKRVKNYLKDVRDNLSDQLSDIWNRAKNWVRNFDPIALDLNGDGAIGVGVSNGILFDHNSDRVKTSTGWVSPEDGFLVIDKNGNGIIDGGAELFGDGNTDSVRGANDPADLSAGLIALRKSDSNNDGVFDAQDAAFSVVKVWRDLNQDGVSQSDELLSLSDSGIRAINLTPTSTNNVNVGNGNVADSTGQFTRTDGTTGGLFDLLLASNTFYREFEDQIALSEKARTIADMQGSGMVRDLILPLFHGHPVKRFNIATRGDHHDEQERCRAERAQAA